MVRPSLENFTAATAKGRILPLRKRMPADLDTPVSAFLKLRATGDRALLPSFLLESVEQGIQVGRYTFIGVSAATTITFDEDTVTIERNGRLPWKESEADGSRRRETTENDQKIRDKELVAEGRIEVHPAGSDPLHFVRVELQRTPFPHDFDLPGPFAGAVGYLGYEMAGTFERLPRAAGKDLGLPGFRFVIPRAVVVFDHVRNEMELVVLSLPDNPHAADPDAAYREARGLLNGIFQALSNPLPPRESPESPESPESLLEAAEPVSNLPRPRFEEMVRAAQQHILAGDCFQIVLSQRYSGPCAADAFEVYRALRILNPSPYLFFLDCGEFQLIGSSPEALVRLQNGKATAVPIAGTRPRGESVAEDKRLADELLSDTKERAEHIMLVDLARNDLGRVCAPGSIEVDSLMDIERYSHVMHIVSKVTGTLRENLDAFDLLRSVFPAGTVSGAPKIRAMEIIAELEPQQRGPYAGAVGYFGRDGSMDMCITIRTIVMQGSRYSVQAGAGIVADSDPAREYEETVNKARALVKAVAIAQERFS